MTKQEIDQVAKRLQRVCDRFDVPSQRPAIAAAILGIDPREATDDVLAALATSRVDRDGEVPESWHGSTWQKIARAASGPHLL